METRRHYCLKALSSCTKLALLCALTGDVWLYARCSSKTEAVIPSGDTYSHCFLGASRCCIAAGKQGPCCKRALWDCRFPVGPLLILANWPAGFGNALLAFHDTILLAKALGRAVLMPPVFGADPPVEFELLADAFGVDIVVIDEFLWDGLCARSSVSSHLHVKLFEVAGAGRGGPWRNERVAMASGEMSLPHQLVEEPVQLVPGLFKFELRGGSAISRAGKWWGVSFPYRTEIIYWEDIFQERMTDCRTEWFAFGGMIEPGSITAFGASAASATLNLPPEFVGERMMKQHACLVPTLSHPKSLASQEHCLVVANLYDAVHWGRHREDHLHFFRHLRFISSIRHAAATVSPGSQGGSFTRTHGSGAGGRRLAWPYVAMHLRTYFLFDLQHRNHTHVLNDLVEKLLEALHTVRRQWPAASGPHLFIAFDDGTKIMLPALIRAARSFARGKVLVLTSAHTRVAASMELHHHVAVDMQLCMEAAAFVGSMQSSISSIIAALRRSTSQAIAVGSDKPFIAFLPAGISTHLDIRLFPASPGLPSLSRIARFFLGMEARVKAFARNASALVCSDTEQAQMAGQFLRDGAIGIGFPVGLAQVRALWKTALFSCTAVAVTAHLYWLNAHLDGGREADGFHSWQDPRSRHFQQALFMQRVWYLLWSGAFALQSLGAPELQEPVLELLRRRTRMQQRCDTVEVALQWAEGDDNISRSNRGSGDCRLALQDGGGVQAGGILIDVRDDDFLCPSTFPQDLAAKWHAEEPAAVPPLAIRLVPRAASTSALMWAAHMEGFRRLYAALALGSARLLPRQHLRQAGCTPGMLQEWSHRLALYAPTFMGLPPQLCPSRCSGIAGRQKVAVVRNPFKRLVSCFADWLEWRSSGGEDDSLSIGGNLSSWSGFGRWVAGLASWIQDVRQQRCNGGVGKKAIEMWRQLQPMAIVLSGWPVCRDKGATYEGEKGGQGHDRVEDYSIIHIETAEDDIQILERRLCAEGALDADVAGNCPRLPRLSDYSARTRLPRPPWVELWNAEIVEHVVSVYAIDFAAFGYGQDPLRLAPLTHHATTAPAWAAS